MVVLLLPLATALGPVEALAAADNFEALGLKADPPSVGTSGEADFRYSVPLPPGRGGAPSITLSYAVSGETVLGNGWQLGAGGAIHRCAGHKSVDGRRVPVRQLPVDRLCLGGQRLIQVNGQGSPVVGPSSADSSGLGAGEYREYRVQTDPIVRVRAFGSAGSTDAGPLYLKVWDQDGSVSVYGPEPGWSDQAALERHTAGAMGGLVLRWNLTKRTDLNGAVRSFFYETHTGQGGFEVGGSSMSRQVVLKEIQYGPGVKIGLSYVNRSAVGVGLPSESVTLAHKEANHLLLDRITSYIGAASTTVGDLTGATAIRTTKLNYAQAAGSKRPMLTSIQTCAGTAASNRCLRVAEFSYTGAIATTFTAHSSLDLPVNMFRTDRGSASDQIKTSRVWAADFNNDGRTDLLRHWISVPPCPPTPCSESSSAAVYLSNGNGTFTQNNFGLGPNVRMGGVLTADFDGDGRIDLLEGDFGAYPGRPATLYKNSGSGFVATSVSGANLWQEHLQSGPPPDPDPSFPVRGDVWEAAEQFFLIDVDDDGKLDVITSRVPANNIYFKYVDPQSLCASIVCTRVYRGDGNGAFTEIATNLAHKTLVTPGQPPLGGRAITDADRDGVADLHVHGSWPFGFVGWFLSDSIGSFRYVPNSPSLPDTGNSTSRRVHLTDDGEPEFVLHDNTAPGALWAMGLNAPTGQSPLKVLSIPHGVPVATANEWHLVSTMDFDGDGNDDLLYGHYNVVRDGAGVIVNPYYEQYVALRLFLVRGLSTVEAAPFDIPPDRIGHTNLDGVHEQKQITLFGNFTGAGLEMLTLGDNSIGGPQNALYTRQNALPADRLLTVRLGAEGVYAFTYGSAVSSGRVAGDSGVVPDAISVPPSGHVVTALSRPTPVPGVHRTVQYSYAGERVSTKGLGGLGFAERREESPGADGSPLTRVVRRSQVHPYVGTKTSESLHLATLTTAAEANQLQIARFITCDALDAQAIVDAAIASRTNCPDPAMAGPAGLLRRSYEAYSSTDSKDLDGTSLPPKSTRTQVNALGYPTQVVQKTQDSRGAYDTTTSFTYEPDVISCSSITECRQWVARVASRTESRSVPSAILSTSAGYGSQLAGPPQPPTSIDPALLSAILMLLLDD